MELGLRGRAALITGASKGIGRAIALGLAEEGVRLALLARTDAALQAAADEISTATGTTVLADWRDDIDTKTLGMLRATQAMLSHMPTDGTGRIINISGIAGSSVLTSALTHGLNNAAMNHLSSYLAADLAAARITVNSVIPGLIATEWRESWAENAGRQRGLSKQDFLDATCREWGIIAGRWGSMREVADVVVFIASDRAAYINGAKLTVDGGYAINVRG
jgi:3-oxoacyl-[acyl-carrier protein] reductase